MKSKRTIVRKRRKHKYKRTLNVKPLKIFFLLVCLAAVFFAVSKGLCAISSSDFFLVKTIDSNVDIAYLVRPLIVDETLFTIDQQKIYRAIEEEYPEFKSIKIVKVFPSTLAITITKRIPFAQLKKDGFYAIDKEYMILEKANPMPHKGLLIVDLGNYHTVIRKGKRVLDERLRIAFRLVEALRTSPITEQFAIGSINAVTAQSTSFFIQDVNIIVGDGDFARKLFLLERLLRQKYNNDLSTLRYIDLRYAKGSENIFVGSRR